MPGDEIVDLRHRGGTSCKDLRLKGECSSHHSFISQELGIRVDLKLPIDTPPICLVCGWGGGAGTSAEPEASFDHDTPKELDTPSSFVADPEGVPVSVCSSSDCEAVTMPESFFLGVALEACVA